MSQIMTTTYVTVSVRRATVIAACLVAFVCAVIVGAYCIGHRDGTILDRVEVCQSFGATDAPACVAVNGN